MPENELMCTVSRIGYFAYEITLVASELYRFIIWPHKTLIERAICATVAFPWRIFIKRVIYVPATLKTKSKGKSKEKGECHNESKWCGAPPTLSRKPRTCHFVMKCLPDICLMSRPPHILNGGLIVHTIHIVSRTCKYR